MQSPDHLLSKILPAVSRTFSINIAYLSKKDKKAIGIAYLICRSLDTIEDDPLLSDEKKIKLLTTFSKKFSTLSPLSPLSSLSPLSPLKSSSDFKDWLKGVKLSPTNPSEQELLDRFHQLIDLYLELPKPYQKAIAGPVLEMSEGMKKFISTYKNKKLRSLKSIDELEKYCYYVAGTVGVMLTNIFSFSINSAPRKKVLQQTMISFGLSLQLTNILKDFMRDKKRGWLYFPQEILQRNQLTPIEFLNKTNEASCKKVQLEVIHIAENHLKKALLYIKALPISNLRHRIFCILPFVFACANISLLKKSKISKKAQYQNKLSRKSIKKMILVSILFSSSNFLIEKYSQRLLK